MKLLTSIGNALGGVIHLVEEPFEDAGKLEKLLATAEKDEPEVKAAVLKLVSLVEPVGADATTDVSAGGLNVASDLKTFNDAAAVYTYVKTTLVPLAKQVYGDFKSDLSSSAGAAPAPAGAEGAGSAPATAAAAIKGPGLDKVVAA
jgi:hypothetical protein